MFDLVEIEGVEIRSFVLQALPDHRHKLREMLGTVEVGLAP
jgi:hypothetical protein